MLDILKTAGLAFFAGVPDSTLRFLQEGLGADCAVSHQVAASEGSAVALAIGYWLATGNVPCVYMQNSGLPNALNPLLSLAHAESLNAPMVLVIGWRGEPGIRDEPQHAAVGAQTEAMLASAGIASVHARLNDECTRTRIQEAAARTVEHSGRLALLVSQSFAPSGGEVRLPPSRGLDKLAVMEMVLDTMGSGTFLAAGIGHTSRELLLLRERRGESLDRDLLCAGGMGYASHIAIALSAYSGRRICVLDGDGAFLMHGLGNALVGSLGNVRLTHILLDNGAHASVGGAPIANPNVDYVALAKAIGYRESCRIECLSALAERLSALKAGEGSALLHVPIANCHPKNLPRPKLAPAKHARQFQAALRRG